MALKLFLQPLPFPFQQCKEVFGPQGWYGDIALDKMLFVGTFRIFEHSRVN